MAVAYDSLVLWYAVVVATAGFALAGLRVAGISLRQARERLDDRFLYGVPWGTIVVVGVVLGVYLFLQRGWWDWYRPVVVRYMAFSLFEPIGWSLAGLAHSGPGHLVGNLISTIVFGPIVEYMWGHHPPRRGPRWSFERLERPWFRAVVAFPVAVFGLGVVSGLVMWGPVIGFSFVVFALVGCSLVHAPVVTLAALIARTGVRVLYNALLEPVSVAEATVRVVRPGWYGTAVQGHLFGLLVGVLLGVALLRSRDRRPDPGRLWLASCVLGFGLSVWAVWWVLGPEQFVLFRALGVALVVAVATAITWLVTDGGTARIPVIGRSPRSVGFAVIVATLVVMSVVGIGLNAVGVGSTATTDGIEVNGYEVFYAENVTDETFGVVDVSAFGLTTSVETSGVVVQSADRRLWYRSIPTTELQTHGERSFRIGDLGWSQRIRAARRGVAPVDNRTVYAVWLDVGDGWEHVWDAPPARADPVVGGHTFDVGVDEGAFSIGVERNGTVERVSIPPPNETVHAHEVTLRRVDGDVYAMYHQTNVSIASVESYE